MLDILSSIASYATLMTVFVGVVFGIVTMWQARRTRYLTAAVELVETVQSTEFTRSLQRIVELPEGARPELILADRELVIAAYVVSHVFEGLGVLVFYRLLPLHLVDHLIGGYERASWRRLEPHILERRASLRVRDGEWFQWLAERMQEDPAPGKVPGAPVAHRDWRLTRPVYRPWARP